MKYEDLRRMYWDLNELCLHMPWLKEQDRDNLEWILATLHEEMRECESKHELNVGANNEI